MRTLTNVQRLNLSKSQELFLEAKNFTPHGLLGVRHPDFYIPDEYPMFYERGYAGRVVDVDGNDYVDLLCAFGPIILGYVEEEINNAVIRQIDKGFCFTMCQDIQNTLIRKLADLMPSAEQGIIGRTGSDCTTIAVRICRGYTGKNTMLRCGYHGWHDWCVEHDRSIPPQVSALAREFKYGDLDSLEKVAEENKDDLAGIIMSPIQHNRSIPVIEPAKGYLEGVRHIADHYKVPLVFDEIRTGFRLHLGGAQTLYGVTPDITCIGKAMANGYPIGACVGKREIFEATIGKNVFVSSTFFPNSVEIVAALKCIEILERENVIDTIWEKSRKFNDGLNSILEEKNSPAYNAGIPVMPYILFRDVDAFTSERLKRFYTEVVRRRVVMSPYHHGYFCYRHTDEDYDQVFNAFADALEITMKEYPVQ
jgi:glutamate-1-semialdehyde aminotransferase